GTARGLEPIIQSNARTCQPAARPRPASPEAGSAHVGQGAPMVEERDSVQNFSAMAAPGPPWKSGFSTTGPFSSKPLRTRASLPSGVSTLRTISGAIRTTRWPTVTRRSARRWTSGLAAGLGPATTIATSTAHIVEKSYARRLATAERDRTGARPVLDRPRAIRQPAD